MSDKSFRLDLMFEAQKQSDNLEQRAPIANPTPRESQYVTDLSLSLSPLSITFLKMRDEDRLGK